MAPSQSLSDNKVAIIVTSNPRNDVTYVVAQALAKQHANIIIISPISSPSIPPVSSSSIGSLDVSIHALEFSPADPTSLELLFSSTITRFGPISVVVGAACIEGLPLPPHPTVPTAVDVDMVFLQFLKIESAVANISSRYIKNGGCLMLMNFSGMPATHINGDGHRTLQEISRMGALGVVQSLAPKLQQRNVRLNLLAPSPRTSNGGLRGEALSLGDEEAEEQVLYNSRFEDLSGDGVLPSNIGGIVGFLQGPQGVGVSGRTVFYCDDNM